MTARLPAFVTFVCALALGATLAGVSAWAEPPASRTRVVDDAFVITIPAGFADDVSELGDNGVMITVSDAEVALVLTVYRPKRVSGPRTALKRHTQALRNAVESPRDTTRLRTVFLGKTRTAHEIDFTQDGALFRARIVSASAAGHVLVATWSWPAAGEGPRRGSLVEGAVRSVARQ